MIIQLAPDNLVFEPRARGFWCQLPYAGHPKGCPNFGKKKQCPPFSVNFRESYSPPYYIIAEFFNLESQIKKMKERHPSWTEKQCRNLLYWQKKVNKNLKNKAESFINSLEENDLSIIEIPEATGIDIFRTCKNIGLHLEKNPMKRIIKIMIIAKKNSISDNAK